MKKVPNKIIMVFLLTLMTALIPGTRSISADNEVIDVYKVGEPFTFAAGKKRIILLLTTACRERSKQKTLHLWYR